MAGEWREVVLEEVAEDVTVGHVGPMASEYVMGGIPFAYSKVRGQASAGLTQRCHHDEDI